MPFCSECGEQVEATWKFCPHCNTKQQTAAVVIGNDSVNSGDITINQMIDEDSLKKSFKEVVSEIHPVCSKCGIKKSELLVCCNQNCNVHFCKGCGYRNVDNEIILYAPDFRNGNVSDFLVKTNILFSELFGYYNNTTIFNQSIYYGYVKIITKECNYNLISYLMYRFCKSNHSFNVYFVGSKGPFCAECIQNEFVDLFNFSGWQVDGNGALINPHQL